MLSSAKPLPAAAKRGQNARFAQSRFCVLRQALWGRYFARCSAFVATYRPFHLGALRLELFRRVRAAGRPLWIVAIRASVAYASTPCAQPSWSRAAAGAGGGDR